MSSIKNHVFTAAKYLAKIYATPASALDYGSLVSPLIGAREVRGKVISTRPTADNSAVEITVKPGIGFTPEFKPGQYIGLGVEINGQWRWRSYSLTSTPQSHGGLLTFFIKRNDEGLVSNHIIDSVSSGSILRLSTPSGDFILPNPLPQKLLFITAGSGITPVMAMLRSLLDNVKANLTPSRNTNNDQQPDIVHIHSERHADNLPFYSELTQLNRDHTNYHLVFIETSKQGRLNLNTELETHVPDWKTRSTWACGSNSLLDNLHEIYKAADLDEQLHTEKFTLQRGEYTGEGGTITHLSTRSTFDCQAGQTILQSAENKGVMLPSGCRIGICHTCMLTLDSGNTVDMQDGSIGEPGQRIKTCTATPLGDIAIA